MVPALHTHLYFALTLHMSQFTSTNDRPSIADNKSYMWTMSEFAFKMFIFHNFLNVPDSNLSKVDYIIVRYSEILLSLPQCQCLVQTRSICHTSCSCLVFTL